MSLYNQVFGPLNADYCLIFYVLMVFTFVSLVMITLGAVMYLFNGGKLNMKVGGLLCMNSLVTLVAYFAYRTLYSICLSSLSAPRSM